MGPICVTITNDDERRTAIERAALLFGCAVDSDEESELDMLTEAIALYDIEIREPGAFTGRRSERH